MAVVMQMSVRFIAAADDFSPCPVKLKYAV
jgi:hypothetical protein